MILNPFPCNLKKKIYLMLWFIGCVNQFDLCSGNTRIFLCVFFLMQHAAKTAHTWVSRMGRNFDDYPGL